MRRRPAPPNLVKQSTGQIDAAAIAGPIVRTTCRGEIHSASHLRDDRVSCEPAGATAAGPKRFSTRGRSAAVRQVRAPTPPRERHMNFPYPVILCDIGGTNVRIARVGAPASPLELLGHLETAAFAGLAEAIEAVLQNHAIAPLSVIACAAGPVSGRHLQLTNAPWHIDGPAVADRLGLAQGLLLNDFEAQALALPALPDAWLTPIGPPAQRTAGVRVILGPGTGLGVAALLETDGRFAALASEAAHIGFGPATRRGNRALAASRTAAWADHGGERAVGTGPRAAAQGAARGGRARRPCDRRGCARRPGKSGSRRRRSVHDSAVLAPYWALCRRYGAGFHGAWRRDARRRHSAAHSRAFSTPKTFVPPSRRRHRSRLWCGPFRPTSSRRPKRCLPAWRRSPPRPAATESIMPGASGADRDGKLRRRCKWGSGRASDRARPDRGWRAAWR